VTSSYSVGEEELDRWKITAW